VLSGIARITCGNRKGERTSAIVLAPGMIPGFRPPVIGISYDFRCETLTSCRMGALDLAAFIRISLGIEAIDFKRMAANYLGRWDLVQLRCSIFMSCNLEERVALILPELSENLGVRDAQGTRLSLTARQARRAVSLDQNRLQDWRKPQPH
jgi:hypothetical protein